jgi:hypothetical protein
MSPIDGQMFLFWAKEICSKELVVGLKDFNYLIMISVFNLAKGVPKASYKTALSFII